MPKTKRKWIQLDPNNPDSLMAQHIYYDTTKTISDKIVDLEGTSLRIKVSDNDTGPDFLQNKIVAGTNVTIDVVNEGANEVLRISSTGSGTGGDLVREIDTYQMTPDDVATGIDVGKAFAIMDTIDFDPDTDGAIWFTTRPKSNWDLTNPISLYLYAIFNGSIASDETCLLQVDIYETVVNSSPTQIVTASQHSITVASTDTGNLKLLSLDQFSITTAESLITVKITRLASDATDTFSGTFQLTRALLMGA